MENKILTELERQEINWKLNKNVLAFSTISISILMLYVWNIIEIWLHLRFLTHLQLIQHHDFMDDIEN